MHIAELSYIEVQLGYFTFPSQQPFSSTSDGIRLHNPTVLLNPCYVTLILTHCVKMVAKWHTLLLLLLSTFFANGLGGQGEFAPSDFVSRHRATELSVEK